MSKKVKCSQCKYIQSEGIFNSGEPIFQKYRCNADIRFIIERASLPRECLLYRSRTLTAWQEVKQDIWNRIKSLPIINLVINKLTNK